MKRLDAGRGRAMAEPGLVVRRRADIAAGLRVNRSADGRARNDLYRTAEWRALRARVLREEPDCRLCGAPASQVDHIEHGEGWRARFFERSNLRALCVTCHASRSARDRAEQMKARQNRNILW